MNQKEIKNIVKQLTLEEKASLCSGKDNWYTTNIDRLDIPSARLSDGPHGLRTQEGEINSLAEDASAKAVCFPAACATASSFDEELVYEMGQALGRESQALGVQVLLGPGINIKRSPLCGRNFEYFSEDPHVAGKMGSAFVKGVQSEGVGTSLKHFFANSQEHRRSDSSSEADERTLREIYLAAFEEVVKEAKPWTIMASYNKINGTYSTENRKYLTDVLRGEWGFDGLVMSDWGATHNRSGAVDAGCALTMPSASDTDGKIVEAVKNGKLSEEALDLACEQVITLAYRGRETHRDVVFEYEKDHELARRVAEESMILLKNENHILPLRKESRLAFIGTFAKKPRFQGGGSSHINSSKVTCAYDEAVRSGFTVSYAKGYSENMAVVDEELIREAEVLAADADVAVIFAGLPDVMETEGADRHHLRMPEGHNQLIERVCRANPQTVVVLHNGAPVEMPWVHLPEAILETYLSGQAVGEAVMNVLSGKVNPSGHLAESFPIKLEDNPSYLFYFGEGDRVAYSERFYVGYRYYTTKKCKTLFPFGHGLSYTSFSYSNLRTDAAEIKDTESIQVSVDVTNTGDVAGKALVQLYVAPPRVEVLRPLRELKGFQKVMLAPGETRTVCFTLSKRAFAHFSEFVHDWRVEDGEYRIQICENAEMLTIETKVSVHATQTLRPIHYSYDMSMGDFGKTPAGHDFLDTNICYMIHGMAAAGFIPKEAYDAMMAMTGGRVNLQSIETMAEHAGMGGSGTSGLGVMLTQPVSLLVNFLPDDVKVQLASLIERLNQEQTGTEVSMAKS